MYYLLDWVDANKNLTNDQIAAEINTLVNDMQWHRNEYHRLKNANPQTNLEKCAVDAAWSRWAAIHSRIGTILAYAWYHQHIQIIGKVEDTCSVVK